jgi:hypothetical protein
MMKLVFPTFLITVVAFVIVSMILIPTITTLYAKKGHESSASDIAKLKTSKTGKGGAHTGKGGAHSFGILDCIAHPDVCLCHATGLGCGTCDFHTGSCTLGTIRG